MASSNTLPAPTFDLETWIANYSGPLAPRRLYHIASHCPSLTPTALALALSAAKSGRDTTLYTSLTDLAARLGHPELSTKNSEWVARQEDANKRELARLEQELKGYKNNLIRESIRMGQEDLASHHLLTGGPPPPTTSPDADPSASASANTVGLNAAYAAFAKMRDFCTTPTHVASMTLKLLLTAALQAVVAQQTGGSGSVHFNALLANANRLRSVGVKEEEMTRLAPIATASAGIAHLGVGNYKDAATTFLNVPFDLTTSPLAQSGGVDFTRAIASANDVAVYGALTSLATLSRADLSTRVLGGPFRAFLELEPHLRKALTLYTTAKYRACLDLLARYYTDWSLDVFLGVGVGSRGGSHVDKLMARIREKSIVAYFSSFSAVSLGSLLETFPPSRVPANTTPAQILEEEILALIENGLLDGRLDVVSGLLVSPRVDAREKSLADAKGAAREIERTLLLRLERVNVELAGLQVVGKSRTLEGAGSGKGVMGEWRGGGW